MNLAEIELNVSELDLSSGYDLVYDLLDAYGLPRASITRLRSGSYDRSPEPNESANARRLTSDRDECGDSAWQ